MTVRMDLWSFLLFLVDGCGLRVHLSESNARGGFPLGEFYWSLHI
jgi:hypothetical protein